MRHFSQLVGTARRRWRLGNLGGIGVFAMAPMVALSWLIPLSNPGVGLAQDRTASVSTAFPSLVYARGGVAVVGVSPVGGGSEGTRPSRLYLSTDMVHWTDVSPRQSQVSDNGLSYGVFEEASFLSRSVGWVTTWDPATTDTTIYRTDDGGRSWSAVAGASQGDHAGAVFWVQLMSPTVAFGESVEPVAPSTSLEMTTDAGETWRTVYAGPPIGYGDRFLGPFEMPMVFIDENHGFSALGIPPAEGLTGVGDFFSTSNGGLNWVTARPPLPKTAEQCPAGISSTSHTSCLYSLPVFDGTRHGVVASTVSSGLHAAVAFARTNDGGKRWQLSAQRSVAVIPNNPQDGPLGQGGFGYPLISIVPASSWWILGWSPAGATTQITTTAGSKWVRATAPIPTGVPMTLQALDASHALLTVEDVTSSDVFIHLLVTANAGKRWTPVRFAARTSVAHGSSCEGGANQAEVGWPVPCGLGAEGLGSSTCFKRRLSIRWPVSSVVLSDESAAGFARPKRPLSLKPYSPERISARTVAKTQRDHNGRRMKVPTPSAQSKELNRYWDLEGCRDRDTEKECHPTRSWSNRRSRDIRC